MEATLAGSLRGEKMAETAIQKLEAEIEQINRLMKHMEATLAGSLRGEKMAETAIQKLEAEIEQINRLVCVIREVEDLKMEQRKHLKCSQAASDSVSDSPFKDREEYKQMNKYPLVELETISGCSDFGDEIASYS
ncbi:hypothetical protein REPUB_Repub15cG0002800 [Reevesia pubescens]